MVQVIEMVLAHRRTDERRPPFTVRQGRPDHLRPHAGAHLPVLVKHRAVQVQPTQGVGIIGAKDLDTPVTRQVHAQLGFVDLGARERPA